MRAVVVSDVHSNMEAFRGVLADAESRGPFDALWCLGDIIGYGAEPGACIDLLRSYPHVTIAGNHDLGAVGVISTESFNPYAAAANQWTAGQLSPEQRDWVRDLPRVVDLGNGFTLTHGSLVDPVWDYLFYASEAAAHLALQATPYGLVGHTHVPRVFRQRGDGALASDVADGFGMTLGDERFVANPGSTGQPRDGDPRAAYAIVDTDAPQLTFHRVEYDIAATQEKILAAGLPPLLASRLSRGH